MKSAEQRHADAQFMLGNMYKNGYGAGKDYAEAVKWYKQSAASGNDKAKVRLKQLKI